jgi:hypothetical protein
MIEALDYYNTRKRTVSIEVPNFDKGFVARDLDGTVMLFFGQRPHLDSLTGTSSDDGWWPSNQIYPLHLPTDTFPEVSWGGKECLEVELKDERLVIEGVKGLPLMKKPICVELKWERSGLEGMKRIKLMLGAMEIAVIYEREDGSYRVVSVCGDARGDVHANSDMAMQAVLDNLKPEMVK